MSLDKQQKLDVQELLRSKAFIRFLDFAVIQPAGIFSAATNGSDGRNLAREGRKELGLDILAMVEQGQPAQHPDGSPVLTMMQVFREKTQSTTENQDAPTRFNRNAELDEPDSDD